MESTETLNFDFERVGSNRRRISSILKAPRTSVKIVEAGLKERQEENSKPTEKRRSSRRVSFAATKNVVVFSKDITSSSDEQTPSPSLTPTGTDSQDANRGIYDGFENLLKAPLQIPHQREKVQFFPDPVLPDGCNQNTLLFGEDTACMDMTHCHTILIDKDSDESGLNFIVNTDIPVSTIGKPKSIEDAMLKKNISLADKENIPFQSAEPGDFGMFLASLSQKKEVKSAQNERSCKATEKTVLFDGEDTACMDMTNCHTIVIENDSNATDLNFSKTAEVPASGFFSATNKGSNMLQGHAEVSQYSNADTDFGLFLASLSKKKGLEDTSSSSSVSTQKVDSEGFFAKLSARRTVIDKENQPPARPECSVPKPQGPHHRKSTILSTDYDFMDLTKSHTAAIDGRGFLKNQQADRREEKPWAIGQSNTISSRPDCDGFMGSLKSPDPDDMDLTKSQTAAISIKGMDVLKSSMSNMRRGEMSARDPSHTQIFSGDDVGMEFTGVVVQDAQPVSHQQRVHHFKNAQHSVDPPNADDMEMTKSQTVVIDTKGCEGQRPSNTRKSLSANRTVMFAQNDEGMELTEAFTGQFESRERGIQISSMDFKTHQNVSSGSQGLWKTSPECDDMEITKSQTVTIDSKQLNQERPVKSRKSLSTNKTVMFTQNDDDDEGMEMTEALTGRINATDHTENNVREYGRNLLTGLTVNSAISSGVKSSWADVSDSDDMQMTKSQTVVIDSKGYQQAKPVGSRKSLSANRTVMFTNEDCMDMTEALTGHINATTSHIDRIGRGLGNQRLFTDPTINPSVPSGAKCAQAAFLDSDDMEMTKSQTVVIDSKDYKQEKPVRWRKSLSANRTVMFANDDCMDMTEALTGNINATSHRSGKARGNQSLFTDPTISPTVPSGSGCLQAAVLDSDDMEMTKSQTVVIDSKNCNQEKPFNSRKSLSTNRSVMFAQNDDGMELTGAFTGQIEPNKRECDTQNVSMGLKMNKAYPARGEADLTSQSVNVTLTKNQTIHQSQQLLEADDMEITKSQTVVIDSKNRRITGSAPLHSSHMDIVRIQSELTDPNQSVKGIVSRNSMRKSLSCVSSSLQNTMFDNEPYIERSKAATVGGDDMEITRSQTVVIDAKHKMKSDDGDPKVHSRPFDRKSDFFTMTDVTLPTSQASALQMSTACEEIEFTSGKAAVLEANPTEVSDCYKSTTKKFFPFESLISNTGKSDEMTSDLSFVTGQKSFFPSLGVDNMELTSSKQMPTCSDVTRKSMSNMATESKSQCSSAEGNDMNRKSARLLPDECDGTPPQDLDPVDPVSLSQQNEAIRASSNLKGQGVHYDRSISLCTDKNVGSAKPDPVSPPDQRATERRDPEVLKEKSRRRSIQDLRSKLRRISQTLNSEPVQSVVDSATVPLPCLDVTEDAPDSPKIADGRGCRSQRSVEVVSEQIDRQLDAENIPLAHNETKPLTSRLSFGGFLPKLPSRPKPVPTDHLVSETTTNIFKSNITTSLPDNFDEMDDINAEQLPEMSSEEDIWNGVEDHSLKQTQNEDSRCGTRPLSAALEDDVFLSTLSLPKSRKRSLPDDGHDDVSLEQKRKQDVSPPEVTGSVFSNVHWDANTVEEPSNLMTKTIDGTSSSSNSTYLKSEATFESTNKYSHCDSQMEKTLDYEFDFHKKIEDESITVNEFLRHFGVDMVIHRSRPSTLPDNFSPKPTPQLEHLLKEQYIDRPKQKVYEADCEKLTDMVEGLKSRMLQQDHPLKHINQLLLPELANLSKEQLQTFGSKLKEKKVLFRKRSKMVSHDMKIGMYSELVRTTQEAKQKLVEKMLETDSILKDLDACIHDLEAELTTVDSALRVDEVHAQSDIQPALQKRQQELKRLDDAVAEKEGQMVHMESEKRKKAEKMERLREEMKDIKKHTSVIHSVNEWKLSLKEPERTQFSFLHNTLFLEVVHQPSSGMPATSGVMEQKLRGIFFDFQLNAEKSECHTILVHDLLSELLKSEQGWLKRYSTTRDIPMLLHEVSLVVSRIRLLGDEIQRLKRWGAMRLGVMEISCADRQVRILFSSLKAFVKFQLTLAVTSAYPFGRIHIQSFQNYIGNTRADQIKDLLSSIEPDKGYLTKIIKTIHDQLLV